MESVSGGLPLNGNGNGFAAVRTAAPRESSANRPFFGHFHRDDGLRHRAARPAVLRPRCRRDAVPDRPAGYELRVHAILVRTPLGRAERPDRAETRVFGGSPRLRRVVRDVRPLPSGLAVVRRPDSRRRAERRDAAHGDGLHRRHHLRGAPGGRHGDDGRGHGPGLYDRARHRRPPRPPQPVAAVLRRRGARGRHAPPQLGIAPRAGSLRRALAGPLAYYYVVTLVAAFALAALEATYALFAQDRLHLSSTGGAGAIGVVFVVVGLVQAAILGGLVGRLISRWGEERLVRGGLVVAAIGYLLVTTTHDIATLAIYAAIAGAGHSLMRPSVASLVSKRSPGSQGLSIGIMDSFDSLGRILGPAWGGWIYHAGIALPYLGAAVALVLTLGFSFSGAVRHVPAHAGSE